jgi:hypothetical protein
MKQNLVWIVALAFSNALTGIAQDQLRVEPRQEKIEMSWEWALEHCMQPSGYELGCRDRGEPCTSGAQCCSNVCAYWECQ